MPSRDRWSRASSRKDQKISTATPHDKKRPRRVPLIVVGASLALIALAPIVVGGVLLDKHATKTDSNGFYASGFKPFQTTTPAFVTEKLDVGNDGPDWLFRKGRLGTLRVTATRSTAKPVFVGITRQSQAHSYLRGVRHDEIDEIEFSPFSVTTNRHPGAAHADRPAGQTIWTASAVGVGRQSVHWHVQKGNWAVVVMNADGSPGVATRVSVGAKLPFVLWLGIGLVSGGGLLAVGGGLLIVAGARRRAASSTLDAHAVANERPVRKFDGRPGTRCDAVSLVSVLQ